MGSIRKFLSQIKENLPTPFNRSTSVLSMVLVYAAFKILDGFLSGIGSLIGDIAIPKIPDLVKVVWEVINKPIQTTLFQLLLFLVIAIPGYTYFDRMILKRKRKEVIFEDDFSLGNKGWVLNYWGSNKPGKTVRIENSQMVFEAEKDELHNQNGENGAYFDLTNGIYKGFKYDVSCEVKAVSNTTMGFQLWIHDTRSKGEVRFPADFQVPNTSKMSYTTSFIGTETNGMRIHLHSKAGKGKIVVKSVKVTKVS